MVINNFLKRKIVLDIETTGMNFSGNLCNGHKIIEIGAIELINRKITKKKFHVYINPDRKIDHSAFKVHGISNNYLSNKPKFNSIFIEFLKFIKDSKLIIHNAKFDISFLNYEFKKLNLNIQNIEKNCKIIDTLKIARFLFPGKKNSLDALCSRFKINNSIRNLHSAIVDVKLLAKVYLIMTSYQKKILFENKSIDIKIKKKIKSSNKFDNIFFKKASLNESLIHKKYLNDIKKFNGICLWQDNK
ncbi:DNA polymerase III subunit epsilon [Buchnera aphidicola]|uniref:DNA polymerase III subunit epsilon n=1 Tax=Buchnera aphidicola TaxID=9 RepID=UPI0031B83BA1